MFAKRTRPDERRVNELSLEELEIIVEERKRIERARAFTQADEHRRFTPITVEPRDKPRKRRRARSWRDNVLLLVELAAAGALIYIIITALGNLQTLNDEVALAMRGQTAQPLEGAPAQNAPLAPALAQGDLPGSSFPPSAFGELPGSSNPPEALPASLGVSVQTVPESPPPTPGPQSPTRIVIPSLNVDWPIVPGDGWEELKRGVGHHIGSVNPGERGNMILSGHNDVFGEVFKNLAGIKNGDEVQVFAGGRLYKYIVRAKRIVTPSELSVLTQTREAVVTLITCHPYRVDTHRLVVIAQLVQ